MLIGADVQHSRIQVMHTGVRESACTAVSRSLKGPCRPCQAAASRGVKACAPAGF
jgi:hypothetical protein